MLLLLVFFVSSCNHVHLVDLVRRYIGFDDEDFAEIRRVKETLKVQEECESFTYKMTQNSILPRFIWPYTAKNINSYTFISAMKKRLLINLLRMFHTIFQQFESCQCAHRALFW